MPAFLVSIPLGVLWALSGTVGQERAGELTVTWHKKTIEVVRTERRRPDGSVYEVESLALRFEGGAKATYGVTTLSAERLVFVTTDGTLAGVDEALAEGNVELIDPEGRLRAERLRYRWRDRTGDGKSIIVEFNDLELRAASIEMRPDRWLLHDVTATSCEGRPPLVKVSTPLIEIDPTRRSTARKIRIDVLGARLGTLPKYSVGGTGESRGFQLPNVGLDSGFVPRLAWRGDFDLTERSFLSSRFRVRMGEYPVAALYAGHSLLPSDLALTTTLPKSELRRLFSGSYVDNIEVPHPKREREQVAKPRASLSVGSVWNEQPADGDDPVSKPWEVIGEFSGELRGWAGSLQARYHRVGLAGGADTTRGVLIGSLMAPQIGLAPGLTGIARVDGRLFRSDDTYAWLRWLGYLAYEPTEQFRLAIGYSAGAESGLPDFAFDDLENRRSWHFRTDISFGPTHLGFLVRYDPRSETLFGRELYVSQVMGCFEPYVVWRQSPNRLSFGFVFRPFERLNGLPARIDLRGEENRLPVGARPP